LLLLTSFLFLSFRIFLHVETNESKNPKSQTASGTSIDKPAGLKIDAPGEPDELGKSMNLLGSQEI